MGRTVVVPYRQMQQLLQLLSRNKQPESIGRIAQTFQSLLCRIPPLYCSWEPLRERGGHRAKEALDERSVVGLVRRTKVRRTAQRLAHDIEAGCSQMGARVV
ncbi:hypothetical protein D3C87_1789540 [compost metagenome]